MLQWVGSIFAVNGGGVYFSIFRIDEVVDQFVVDTDGFNVDLFVADLGRVDPFSRMSLQEALEEDAYSGTGEKALDQDIVVFVLASFLDIPYIPHSQLLLLTLFQSLHVIPEGFAKILGDIFSIPLGVVFAIYGGFLKEANFFIPASLQFRRAIVAGRVRGREAALIVGDKGTALPNIPLSLRLLHFKVEVVFNSVIRLQIGNFGPASQPAALPLDS